MGDGHLADVIASQLQGALAADVQFSPFHRPVVFGERGETIGQLKQMQILARRLDAVEAAHILVVLVKAADDQFHRVVGQGDEGVLHRVDQLGVVAFQEVEDALRFRHLGHILLFQGHHFPIAFVDRLLALGLEDFVDLFLQSHGFGMGLGVIVAVDLLDQSLRPLQGVEDALVMRCARENGLNGLGVVLIHIGDDDLGGVALGLERLQEGTSLSFAVVGVDVNMQQVIGEDVHRQVDVHPPPAFPLGLVVLGHQHPFLVYAHHATGTHYPKQGGDRQRLLPHGHGPSPQGDVRDAHHIGCSAIGRTQVQVDHHRPDHGVHRPGGVEAHPVGVIGESLTGTGRVETVAAIALRLTPLPCFRVAILLAPGGVPLAGDQRGATVGAADAAIIYLLPLAKEGPLQAIGEGQRLLQRRDGRPHGLFQGFHLQRQLRGQALSGLKPGHQDLIELKEALEQHLVPPLWAVGGELEYLAQQATHLGEASFPGHLVDTLQGDVFYTGDVAFGQQSFPYPAGAQPKVGHPDVQNGLAYLRSQNPAFVLSFELVQSPLADVSLPAADQLLMGAKPLGQPLLPQKGPLGRAQWSVKVTEHDQQNPFFKEVAGLPGEGELPFQLQSPGAVLFYLTPRPGTVGHLDTTAHEQRPVAIPGAQQPLAEQHHQRQKIEIMHPTHQVGINSHFQHAWPKQGQKGQQGVGQWQAQQRPGQRPALRPSAPHQQDSHQTQATEQHPPPPFQEAKTGDTRATAATKPTSSRPNEQSLIPHLAALERGEGLKQQTDEQQKGKTTIDGSLLKMECGTIHGVGSFVDFGHLVLYQISREEPTIIFCDLTWKEPFSHPLSEM